MLEIYHRRSSVEKITGLSRSLIYEMMAREEFPRPIRIGRRAVAWRESDIAEWQARCASDAA
ncbi:MAG: AlpA family phage regulatory protein [Rhodobacteraceae bacterium]|nr:AlpA family phage regulatory protein [Paracoccaceae bacterium]